MIWTSEERNVADISRKIEGQGRVVDVIVEQISGNLYSLHYLPEDELLTGCGAAITIHENSGPVSVVKALKNISM